jgi:DNA-binding NtrC family response regulator
MSRRRILIVDDEPGVRFGVGEYLTAQGFDHGEATTCAAAQEALGSSRFDAAILDYALPDGNALDLLPRLRAADPTLPVIVLTGHGSIDLAVRAIREGADHFLTKPVELPALLVILRRLLENRQQRQRQLAGRARPRRGPDPFLGTSPLLRRLAEDARRVCATESPVLIQGETGAGKGVLARWIHDNGPRADEAFVDLNCAGLSRDLLETEIFGHEKGAFTGAAAAKVGLLEVAHRGTVFLDELGDMDPLVQPKLLKVLEEQRFRRLGDVRDREVDVRLVAATHQELSRLVQEKRFRSDLYFRISTIPLTVPPLRDRAEDVPLLARYFLELLGQDLGRGALTLSEDAARALQAYRWPGNIRELRNVLERAVLLSEGSVLRAADLRFEARGLPEPPPSDSSLTLLEVEKRHIMRVLEEEGGRVDSAAKRLGIPRSTLYQKIKRHGIGSRPDRGPESRP